MIPKWTQTNKPNKTKMESNSRWACTISVSTKRFCATNMYWAMNTAFITNRRIANKYCCIFEIEIEVKLICCFLLCIQCTVLSISIRIKMVFVVFRSTCSVSVQNSISIALISHSSLLLVFLWNQMICSQLMILWKSNRFKLEASSFVFSTFLQYLSLSRLRNIILADVFPICRKSFLSVSELYWIVELLLFTKLMDFTFNSAIVFKPHILDSCFSFEQKI